MSYTGSDHIDITDNQVSLNFPIKINDGIMLNPRAYDGDVFEMLSSSTHFAVRQNPLHGGSPMAQLYPSTKACTFHGGCEIPNMYDKTFVDLLIADICNDICFKTRIDT